MPDFQKSDHQPEADVGAETAERRRTHRYPFDLGEALVATKEGRSHIATVRGVSATGIGLLFDEVPSLEIGQVATVTCSGAPKKGIVRHVTPLEQDSYLVGLEWIAAEG